MGRKKAEEETKPKAEEKADEPEDTPFIKDLKEIDDKYLALEKEFEKQRHQLKQKYEAKQQPFLDQRTKLLTATGDDGPETGTPALSGFWVTALRNHPAFEDMIEEWDAPVLEYITDITQKDNDETDPNAGFTLTFKFATNPYITNETLTKVYKTEEKNPYSGEMAVKAIKADTVDWKPGKDVTVEKVAKKVKGGGSKKAKQKGKESEEPRMSFFRNFFRSLAEGDDLPDDIDLSAMGADEDEDADEVMDCLMENDHDAATEIRDSIIPFAVRWYTGEAAPEQDDDDEDEEEEDDDDDDDDDEESSEEPPAKGKKGGKKKGGKPSPKSSPGSKPKDAPKEECKQQ